MRFNFICHPYHRGGVTSWMKNAFLETQTIHPEGLFLTVLPKKVFLSAGHRPNMVDFLDHSKNVCFKKVGVEFEFGNLEYKSSIYRSLILEFATERDVIIPSDDEACWRACCQLSTKFKVIGVLHSDDAKYFDLYQKYSKYLSGVISVSKRIKTKLVDFHESIPNDVIPCGIPLKDFKVDIEKRDKISWIGRIEEEQKRVSDIIKIAMHMKLSTLNWEMHVFGDGAQLEDLKIEAIKNKLDKNLKFHGWTSEAEIRTHLSSSKILLQTSNFEGMSVVVMEALASGCLVVSSKVSGIEDLMDDPNAKGIVHLFKVGDIGEAEKQLLIAMENYSFSLSRKALLLADKYYSISNCMKKYQEFCKPLKMKKNNFRSNPKWLDIFSYILAYVRFIRFKSLG